MDLFTKGNTYQTTEVTTVDVNLNGIHLRVTRAYSIPSLLFFYLCLFKNYQLLKFDRQQGKTNTLAKNAINKEDG